MHSWNARPFTTLLLTVLLLGTLGLAGIVGSEELFGLSERVDGLTAELAQAPVKRLALEAELEDLRCEISQLQAELEQSAAAQAEAEALAARLSGAENRLLDIAGTIEAQGSSLKSLSEASSTLAPTLEERIAAQAEQMSVLWQGLRERVDATESLAESSMLRLDEVDRHETRDVVRMWSELVGPTVQLAGENSVGSGVLLRSREVPSAVEGETTYVTYVLTAWHVVRDIVEGEMERPVPVVIYPEDGTTLQETATLLRHDPVLDAALLKLDSSAAFDFGADLAPRSRLSNVRIFDPIYAVGCPLGNDPIPTPGEVATCHHLVEGLNYWMINAPTSIGNSGGGIFDAQSHELLGIFSKIYTHGSLRPTIVPHMGLVTPLASIYDWLDTVGFGQLIPAEAAVAGAR
jgi:S1-C subfamily serine protease